MVMKMMVRVYDFDDESDNYADDYHNKNDGDGDGDDNAIVIIKMVMI